MGVDTRSKLEDGIRGLVVERLESDPQARHVLSRWLGLPAESVDRLLSRDRWDLSLAMSVADYLGLDLHVSRS